MSTPKSSVTSVFSGLEHGNATRMELNARGGIQSKSRRASRQLGDTEASYFWPSRENGVNDMYLCVGITAPVHLFKQESTVLAWAILRLRHPLLASRVEMLSYDDVNFVYDAPSTVQDALLQAKRDVEYRNMIQQGQGGRSELINSFLNGSRLLSIERTSRLLVSIGCDDSSLPQEINIMICAAHYVADALGVNALANEFLYLLGMGDDRELLAILASEILHLVKHSEISSHILPAPLEKRFISASSPTEELVERIDFEKYQSEQIGGQSFPRRFGRTRHSVTPIVIFDEVRTQRILEQCKQNGVSLGFALFSLCNMTWARTNPPSSADFPTMLYSAINVRFETQRLANATEPLPGLTSSSFFFVSIGYFNIVLPPFPLEGNMAVSFWLQSQLAMQQANDFIKHPHFSSRNREMAKKRAGQARLLAKKDDEKTMNKWQRPKNHCSTTAGAQPLNTQVDMGGSMSSVASLPASPPPAPSQALLGLSLIGNLDRFYQRSDYPKINPHTLLVGVRQRAGGVLLISYMFGGKLHISFPYDRNGFDEKVLESFWKNFVDGVGDLVE